MIRTAASAFVTVTFLSFTFVVDGCRRPFYGYQCSEMCGAKLTNSSGTIHSPGYETQYANNEQCSWDVIPETENSSVLITFQSFSTEALSDYLSIFADPSHSALVARYSGNELPYQIIHKGPLYLKFTSNRARTDKGFKIHYDIVHGIAPRFVSDMKETTAVVHETVLLPCHVTGVPEPDVIWYKDGLQVHSALQSQFVLGEKNLSLIDVMEEDAGIYKCRAENFLNYTEQAIRLTVHVRPVITTHPASIHLENVFSNSTVSDAKYNEQLVVFQCSVHGVPKPIVYWKKDGRFLVNLGDCFDVKVSTMFDIGNYSCFANSTAGSAESRPASLTIGEVLPCCLRNNLGRIDPYNRVTMGQKRTRILFYFAYRSYTLLNIMMTKDGQSYLAMDYDQQKRSNLYRISMTLKDFSHRGTGIYGWHLRLSPSNSTGLNETVVSSYIVITVEGPPQIVVSPSNVLIRDYDKQLIITCSANSFQDTPTFEWFSGDRPLGSGSTMAVGRRMMSYVTVNDSFDNSDLENYTCTVRNSWKLTSKAAVLVIKRVAEAGGWSGWTETSHCSETCGSGQGVWLRRRLCLNNRQRCTGPNIEIRRCFPSVTYCPTVLEDKHTQMSGPVVTPTVQNTTVVAGSSDSSVVVTSIASAVATGIASAVLAAALTYCYMRRKNRREMNTTLDTLTSTMAVSTSDKDSSRYAPQAVLDKNLDASSQRVYASAKNMTDPATNPVQYQLIQSPNTTSKYTPLTKSQCAEDLFYETTAAKTSDNYYETTVEAPIPPYVTVAEKTESGIFYETAVDSAEIPVDSYITVTEGTRTVSRVSSVDSEIDYLTLCPDERPEDATEHKTSTSTPGVPDGEEKL